MAVNIQDMPRPRRTPTRPPEDVVRRLAALGELNREWVAEHADEAGFHPDAHPKPGTDYPLHHVELDAPAEALDEFYRRADEIMGLPRP